MELVRDWRKKRHNGFGRRVWEVTPYAIMWILWVIRNAKIFKDKAFTIEGICVKMNALIWYWIDCWNGRNNYHFKDLVDH
ncbi:hypothetical protein FRX31_019912 [Thalictrum thalictroides]|uniref:Uncharacterized protein n=1 Tax=Thalictrum thalictroides TaxID=46969 RepID=A0A7J6W035_THATH|nr:hypothetical protein FRX31_019912 [Thalictrum thalictroides]